MKIKTIISLSIGILCFTGIIQSSLAQCTCNQTRLNNIIDNVNVKLVASYGSNTAVTSINPGTTYYLRVQATSYTCLQNGSGCNGIFAPVAFYVDLADGCTVFGDYVPPQVGLDVGSGNNYTAYFTIQTFTGGDFLEQLYFRVKAVCFPSPTCGLLTGTKRRQFLLP
jgi:hypothetical protein